MSISRFFWLAGSLAATLLLMIVMALSPVELQITLIPKAHTAQAGLPTTTPVPPTAVPTTQATITAVPPTAAPATATSTVVPPTLQPRRPTATAEMPTVTPLPDTQHSPQLAILKDVEPAQVQPGERATFLLRVSNLGDAPASDVVVTDEVPPQLEVVDLHSTKGDIVVHGQLVMAYPRTLEPSEVQTFSIVVRVREHTTDREIANLAVVTLGQPDDPGDNTSITTLWIDPPGHTAAIPPPSLPKTADPTALTIWAQYWPLLALSCVLLACGVATRRGSFRAQSMQITVGGSLAMCSASAAERHDWLCRPLQVTLDPADLMRRWQAGCSTTELVDSVACCNTHADRLAVSIAVQRVLQRLIDKQPA